VTAPALYRRVARNVAGRDFIAGDLHGTLTEFLKALNAAGFDENAGDRLFLAGDLVDRGPESDRMLRLLEQPWCTPCAGITSKC